MNRESIAWENTEGYGRSNGLPAVMYRDGDIEYWLNGNPQREDGPCFILHNFHGDKLRLGWDKESNSDAEGFLAGAIINEHGSKRYYTGTYGSDDEIGKEEYETIIKRKFPKATKIWLEDYL